MAWWCYTLPKATDRSSKKGLPAQRAREVGLNARLFQRAKAFFALVFRRHQQHEDMLWRWYNITTNMTASATGIDTDNATVMSSVRDSSRGVQAESLTRKAQQRDWVFRDPQKEDTLHIFYMCKLVSIVNVSNSDKNFTVRLCEEVAVWLTEDDVDAYNKEPNKADFRPSLFVDTFAYDAVEINWQEALRTPEGSQFHIRPIREKEGEKYKCCAWRLRLGRVTFNQPFELRHFPYDVQKLDMSFQFVVYTNDERTKIPSFEQTKISEMYGGATTAIHFSVPSGEYKLVGKYGIFFFPHTNNVTISFLIERDFWFYFGKVMVVQTLISFSAVAVFVDWDSFLGQVTYLSTILLTFVSNFHVLNTYLPKLE